jgi:ornithine cyclodeaminase/alanine dehydrogenase-like protein (mu-crystallin family)
MQKRTPLYLTGDCVKACLSDDEVYSVVQQTLGDLNSARLIKGPKAGFELDIRGHHMHLGSVSGALISDSAVGIKWYAVADENPSRNLPRVPATILVCDAETGLLNGVLDGTQLTPERTAAAAVVAASACGRPMNHVAVIGAGAIGHALVRFLGAMEEVENITVMSRRESDARKACDAAAHLQNQVTLSATSDVREAVRDADVVFTATAVPVDTDLVQARWLKEGAVVCSVGSRREVDLELISQAWIVVDDELGVKMRRSDFRQGGVGADRIAADIGSVISGEADPPPQSTKIHIVFVGLGVLDVALGARAIAIARTKGLGVPLG